MGAIFRHTGDGKHVSTGKYPYPAGQVHDPVWGPEWHDMGYIFRSCLFDGDGCDLDELVRKL
jgi:hypothetical protein